MSKTKCEIFFSNFVAFSDNLNFNETVTKIYSFIDTMFFSLRLERLGEKDLGFIKWRSSRHCFKKEWTLVSVSLHQSVTKNQMWITNVVLKSCKKLVLVLNTKFHFNLLFQVLLILMIYPLMFQENNCNNINFWKLSKRN